MADRTGIEWTDATWNPVRGCIRVSPGCRNCYAERMAARFSGKGLPYHGLAEMRGGRPRWTGKLTFGHEIAANAATPAAAKHYGQLVARQLKAFVREKYGERQRRARAP